MKTREHPFSRVLHFAIGGMITPEKAEFRTLCGRKFKQGHSELMAGGAYGAGRTTCKVCKRKLKLYDNK